MNPLFLIGYRGTGKSTVARLLADSLGWQWCDADVLLEERAGKTIKAIFDSEGEGRFRDLEASLLEELSGRKNHIIATGGGIILRPANRERLKAGRVVWLAAPAAELWRRLQNDIGTAHRRPDLAQGGLAEIEAMLALREPLYAECAHRKIDTGNRAVADIVSEIGAWMTEQDEFSR